MGLSLDSGSYLLSNLTLSSVNASGHIEWDFEKRITQPADNLNTSITEVVRKETRDVVRSLQTSLDGTLNVS